MKKTLVAVILAAFSAVVFAQSAPIVVKSSPAVSDVVCAPGEQLAGYKRPASAADTCKGAVIVNAPGEQTTGYVRPASTDKTTGPALRAPGEQTTGFVRQ